MSLSVSGVSVRFGAFPALVDVELEVAEHEVVAVLGPSGSGKSTLLRVIAGLQEPSAGRVVLDGVDVTRVPPHRRGVGLMFQDHALFTHKDVAGNIRFGNTRADVASLLSLVGLPDVGPRAVVTLSGGEQQRVALARALAPSPKLLMLDEPLGQLDRELRERLVVELRRLFVRLGTTVLAVTHDQREAFALADRVVVMAGGRIAQVGTPREVWEQPASEFVARFLGFTNVAPAVVRDGVADTPWGTVAVAAADGSHPVLVRPAGVLLSTEADDVTGVVEVATFAGERVDVLVKIGDAPSLEAHCPAATAPAVGETVSVRLDPAQTVVLPRNSSE
ncbi:ABC transporter ATP-binding protein [Cryptosporangium arvum]|uniref:ABC-type quaternary amine transporter n=1 Tax=Cryptosporangium arvum DSM 44712 TaxID=927661 RepID=A0A010ZPD6_9ACTN|nr:ABC transporter ATP-binding protein [Cryptosporangium arvum]EXG79092.1 ABC-type spermidine/putrescine transport system, ATPase component [Cryptosporangium arvum DSM 44712]